MNEKYSSSFAHSGLSEDELRCECEKRRKEGQEEDEDDEKNTAWEVENCWA